MSAELQYMLGLAAIAFAMLAGFGVAMWGVSHLAVVEKKQSSTFSKELTPEEARRLVQMPGRPLGGQ